MTKRETINEMANVVPEKIKDPLDNSRYIIFGNSLRQEIARIYYNAGYRKIDEFSECRNCTAWSGTDCTRHPYTQGCLKDENNIKRQAVKEIVEKLKEKSFYIQTAEDNYHVVELSTVYAILKEYEKL